MQYIRLWRYIIVKIQVVSDLHFEFLPDKEDRDRVFAPSDIKGDILIMAGDISNSPAYVMNLIGHASKTIILLGNHEYYGHDKTRLQYWKDWFSLHDDSVSVLDNEVVEFPEYDLRIIGSTFWASLENGRQADNCRRFIADFHVIAGMTPDIYMNEHQKSKDYIDHVLGTPFAGKTVVATHHAPSWKSQHPKYSGSAVGGLFCSNAEYLMEKHKPEVWIHGHTHDAWDYKLFDTRVVCNPAGYIHEQGTRLNKEFIIEL